MYFYSRLSSQKGDGFESPLIAGRDPLRELALLKAFPGLQESWKHTQTQAQASLPSCHTYNTAAVFYGYDDAAVKRTSVGGEAVKVRQE